MGALSPTFQFHPFVPAACLRHITASLSVNMPGISPVSSLGVSEMWRYAPFWPYARQFCGLKKLWYGYDWSGASNLDKLHELLLREVMIILYLSSLRLVLSL